MLISNTLNGPLHWVVLLNFGPHKNLFSCLRDLIYLFFFNLLLYLMIWINQEFLYKIFLKSHWKFYRVEILSQENFISSEISWIPRISIFNLINEDIEEYFFCPLSFYLSSSLSPTTQQPRNQNTLMQLMQQISDRMAALVCDSHDRNDAL